MTTLVIGGTKGIGAVIANKFQDAGETVTRWGRANAADAWNEPLNNLIFCQRYRGEPKSWKASIMRFLYTVILRRPWAEQNVWNGEIETSLTLTRRIIETFPLARPASIVIISSIIASTVADEQPAAYHMAKAALESMARYYAVKLGPQGVRVNCVSPGVTLKSENAEYYKSRPDKVRLFSELNPIGRMVTAADIATTVWAVCYHLPATTGEVIRADGGVHVLNVESVARRLLPK